MKIFNEDKLKKFINSFMREYDNANELLRVLCECKIIMNEIINEKNEELYILDLEEEMFSSFLFRKEGLTLCQRMGHICGIHFIADKQFEYECIDLDYEYLKSSFLNEYKCIYGGNINVVSALLGIKDFNFSKEGMRAVSKVHIISQAYYLS